MNNKKYLLISGTIPGEPGVGGVILNEFVKHAGIDKFATVVFSRAGKTQFIENLTTFNFNKKYETSWRPVRGITGEIVSRCATIFLRDSLISKVTAEINKLISDLKTERIVTVLESPFCIEVMNRICRNTKVPITSIVWDDVELFSQQSNLDRWTDAALNRSFANVLKASSRVAVICENMQQEYQKRYNVNSQILRLGVDPQNLTGNQETYATFKIGFAGSITTPDCMQSLINTLDSINWTINGKKIILRMMGVRYLLQSRLPQQIEFYGWRSQEETHQLLGECDCVYLPQSFLDHLKHFSQLSFPTKLSTYVACGKPILLHAPEYSSLASLWNIHPAGPHCKTLGTDELLQSFQKLVDSSQDSFQEWIKQSTIISETILSKNTFHNNVDNLLAVI